MTIKTKELTTLTKDKKSYLVFLNQIQMLREERDIVITLILLLKEGK